MMATEMFSLQEAQFLRDKILLLPETEYMPTTQEAIETIKSKLDTMLKNTKSNFSYSDLKKFCQVETKKSGKEYEIIPEKDNRTDKFTVASYLTYCYLKYKNADQNNETSLKMLKGRFKFLGYDKDLDTNLSKALKICNKAKGISASGSVSDPVQPSEVVQAVRPKTEISEAVTGSQVSASAQQIKTVRDKRPLDGSTPTMKPIQMTADNNTQDESQDADEELPTTLVPDTIFDCVEIIPKKYILDGVIEDASIVMVAGREKIGKSYALCHLAMCMATEKPWLGLATMQDAHGGILWVNLDMKRDKARQRTNEIANGLCEQWSCSFDPNMFSNFYIIHSKTFRDSTEGQQTLTFDGNNENAVKEMKRMIKDPRYNIKVCFIDSQIQVSGDLDENKSEDARDLFKVMKQLRDDTGCSFILIHHNTKYGDRARGSSGLFAETDLNLQLSQDTNDHDKLILLTDGARDTAENNIGMLKLWKPRLNLDGSEMTDSNGHTVWNFSLEPIDANSVSTTATETIKKKQEASDRRYEQAVIKALEGEVEGLSQNDIKKKAHIDKQQCGWAIHRLCDRNELIQLDNGKYKLP